VAARSVFALEICLRLEPSAHEELRRVAYGREDQRRTPSEQWQQYARLSELLWAYETTWVRGCWEFFNEDAKAESTFADWKRSMHAAAERPRGPSTGLYRGAQLYMTFTLATLLRRGSPCEQALNARCSYPEQHLWLRSTFRNMVDTVRMLAPPAVVEDTLYLIPGASASGITEDELREPLFKHLRPIG
jgi:hypothetical protein